MARMILKVFLAGLGCLLASCGSFTPAETRVRDDSVDLGRLPPDFAVSVTILLPGNTAWAGAPAWLVPAWYVVEADSKLRAMEGVRAPGSPIPPIVRTLRYEEVAELWSTVRAGGLDAGRDADVPNSVSIVQGVPEAIAGGVVRPTAALYVSSSGRRRGYMVDLSAKDAAAARARDLAARVAELSSIGRGEE